MTKMLRYSILIPWLLLSLSAQSQIWTEDFQDETDDDESGTGSPDLGGWTTTQPSTNDRFWVQSLFGARYFQAGVACAFCTGGTGSEGVWTSPDIDISSFVDVKIYVETGSVGTEAGDYMELYYQLDEGSGFGSETLFHTATLGSVGSTGISPALNGDEIRIVMRAFTNAANDIFTMDNIAVTNTLFSRKTGNWNDATASDATWSASALGGASCDCSPDDNTEVVIGDGDNVTITAAAQAAGLEIQNTGTLTYGGNFALGLFKTGGLQVDNGGTITNGVNNGASISFTDNTSHTFTNNGTISIGDLIITNSSLGVATTITMSGSGTTTITDDVTIDETFVQSAALNNSATITITDDVTLSNNTSFTNTGTITIGTGGVLTMNDASDFNNDGTVTMNNTAAGALAGAGSFIQGASDTFNYSGSTITVTTFTATAAGNTVNYQRSGAQTIRATTYDILQLTGSGAKTLGGNITINDDWTLGASTTLTPGTNTVTFSGTTSQNVITSSTLTLYNATVNNSGGDIIINNGLTISNNLTLTNGGVNLSGNILSITNTAGGAIARTNGWIYDDNPISWVMGTSTGTHTFAWGEDASNYIPLVFNITAAGGDAGGTISASTYDTAPDNTPFPAGVDNVDDNEGEDNSAQTVDRFWDIGSSYGSGPTITVTFTASTAEVGGITNLQAQRWNGDDWEQALPGQSSGANSATVPGVTTFSPWALASSSSPLPIELLSFEVKEVNGTIELIWKTATELNNDFFTIEKSTDLEYTEVLTQMPGNGTTSNIREYSFKDYLPSLGWNYYRLKQTDYDGTSETFSWKGVYLNEERVPSILIAPNPANGQTINIRMQGMVNKQLNFKLYNQVGQEIDNISISSENGSVSYQWVQKNKLPRGVYFIKSEELPFLNSRVLIE
ncbi:MAG: hypothetical protein RJQ09_19965 [Cyclobacteriaceae bacterium]